MSTEPATLLEWDSEFFGCRVARASASRLTADSLERLLQWCRVASVDWLYFLADSDDRETVACAERAGFRFVDIRVELELSLGARPRREPSEGTRVSIRSATPEDLATIGPIAADVHTDSRYFFDAHVPRERARALYERWIEQSVMGRLADVVLVADVDGTPAGYVTGKLSEDSSASIGLIGVGRNARGHGVGRALMRDLLSWAESRKLERVTVVTHGRNVVAQRLYQGFGFRTRAVSLWYHYRPAA